MCVTYSLRIKLIIMVFVPRWNLWNEKGIEVRDSKTIIICIDFSIQLWIHHVSFRNIAGLASATNFPRKLLKLLIKIYWYKHSFYWNYCGNYYYFWFYICHNFYCVYVFYIGAYTHIGNIHTTCTSEVHFVIIKLEYPTIKWC